MPRIDHMVTFGIFLLILALAAVAGAMIDRKLFRDEYRPVKEPVALEEPQDDGSTLLHREPGASLDNPVPAAPRGHTPVRDVEVEVRPPAVDVTCGDGTVKTVDCPVVTVGFRLLRVDADGTYRVQGYSPDGELLGGIDVPHVPAMVPVVPVYSVGVAYFSDGARQASLGKRFGKVHAEIYLHETAEREREAGVGVRLPLPLF